MHCFAPGANFHEFICVGVEGVCVCVCGGGHAKLIGLTKSHCV